MKRAAVDHLERVRHRPPTDCFQEVLQGDTSTIRHSWLLEDAVYYDAAAEEDEVQSPSDTSASSTAALSQEIVSLTQQLLLMKRRFASAAAACADLTPEQAFSEARRSTNPYERLGEGRDGGLNRLFLNRSAMKLANIDVMEDFGLVSCSDFVFVDLCGAPGGFSEYLMLRAVDLQAASCTGIGMSLLGADDHGQGTPWRLNDCDRYEQGTHWRYRIHDGEDGTGNVCQWSNVEYLAATLHQLSGRRADLVTGDGGADAQRNADDQEGLTQKLVVCQASAAVRLLSRGGRLVLKLFGAQTPVLQCLLAELARLFHRLRLVKPICSRPASAERYLIAKGFCGLPEDWTVAEWQSRILLGRSRVPVPLSLFWHGADRDLLVLNLQACAAILTELERLACGEDALEVPPVHVALYRRAWRLE